MAEFPNDVRVVWRNYPLPFHQDAHLAHEAAIEILRQGGAEKFWAYHDVLFANQRALSRDDLERYARELGGIQMRRFRQALERRRHEDRVEADIEAIRDAGARIGTPSLFINGRLLQGAQPLSAFRDAVQRELGGTP